MKNLLIILALLLFSLGAFAQKTVVNGRLYGGQCAKYTGADTVTNIPDLLNALWGKVMDVPAMMAKSKDVAHSLFLKGTAASLLQEIREGRTDFEDNENSLLRSLYCGTPWSGTSDAYSFATTVWYTTYESSTSTIVIHPPHGTICLKSIRVRVSWEPVRLNSLFAQLNTAEAGLNVSSKILGLPDVHLTANAVEWQDLQDTTQYLSRVQFRGGEGMGYNYAPVLQDRSFYIIERTATQVTGVISDHNGVGIACPKVIITRK